MAIKIFSKDSFVQHMAGVPWRRSTWHHIKECDDMIEGKLEVFQKKKERKLDISKGLLVR